jgi:hypothetical protein
MREYARVTPQFWTGDTGKFLKAAGPETQVLALYLLTCPSSNMLGLYYLPMPTLCHETGLSAEGASKALRRVSEGEFAHYDPSSEVVWVVEMARFQIADKLKSDDNRCKGIAKELEQYRKTPFYLPFHGRYGKAFHLPEPEISEAPSKPLASPLQAPSKPGTGTGAGTGEGSTSANADVSASADAPAPGPKPEDLQKLWNDRAGTAFPRCRELTAKRRQHAKVRLSERPLDEWAQVIDRINASPFCRGDKQGSQWRATFDWLLKPDTAAKVLEGAYDDKGGGKPTGRITEADRKGYEQVGILDLNTWEVAK